MDEDEFTKCCLKAISRWDMRALGLLAGGLWLNKGFSTAHGEKLKDWQVSLQGVEVK